jgi:hypothetical protein
MIMQKMRRAEHVPPESKAGFYPVVRSRPGRGADGLFLAPTRIDHFPSACATALRSAFQPASSRCFVGFSLTASARPAGPAMAKDGAAIKNLIHCILSR